eukprot:6473917-Amphidinium_carterae.1
MDDVSDTNRKDHRGRYVATADGPICFKFNASTCPEPCPNKRLHLCQNCLGKHPLHSCPSKPVDKAVVGCCGQPLATTGPLLVDLNDVVSSWVQAEDKDVQVMSLGEPGLEDNETMAGSEDNVCFGNCFVQETMAEWPGQRPCTEVQQGRGFEPGVGSVGKVAFAESDGVGQGAVAHHGIVDAEVEAVGGLKDTARSVGKLPILREAGRQLREVFESIVRSRVEWQGE